MPTLPAESVDSIVTDPPYGLSFMGKNWDHGIPGVAFWTEALRVAKPGTHLLAFGGTRTFHRLTCAIEDAGWEIRDCIMWVYGSGFPKSLDVSKAIDREAGAEREVVGSLKLTGTARIKGQAAYGATSGRSEEAYQDGSEINDTFLITAPATPEAQQWAGWGTALKPAWEPIIVARKPPVGTVAANVLRHGTGAINVDGCRIASNGDHMRHGVIRRTQGVSGDHRNGYKGSGAYHESAEFKATNSPLGRWPANLIHDGSDEVVGLFPETASGERPARTGKRGGRGFGMFDDHKSANATGTWPADNGGSAARFFYVPKASKSDRDEGCEELEMRENASQNYGTKAVNLTRKDGGENRVLPTRNHHPTVKPTTLMRYLCRLVTPPGGTVLDPFCGSGSTGKAATLEGFEFIGIEREAEYAEIARARIAHARGDMPLLESFA